MMIDSECLAVFAIWNNQKQSSAHYADSITIMALGFIGPSGYYTITTVCTKMCGWPKNIPITCVYSKINVESSHAGSSWERDPLLAEVALPRAGDGAFSLTCRVKWSTEAATVWSQQLGTAAMSFFQLRSSVKELTKNEAKKTAEWSKQMCLWKTVPIF